jgi:hypothetical protein
VLEMALRGKLGTVISVFELGWVGLFLVFLKVLFYKCSQTTF